MRSLELAAALAKSFEGLRLAPYHDPVGFPTVGYGHLLARSPWAALGRWPAINETEATRLLARDMRCAISAVRRLITVDLSDVQEAALIDFAFNCGAGNLADSTLRRVINRGDYDAAPEQFMRWVYARHKRLAGLVRRRAAEVEIWQSGDRG